MPAVAMWRRSTGRLDGFANTIRSALTPRDRTIAASADRCVGSSRIAMCSVFMEVSFGELAATPDGFGAQIEPDKRGYHVDSSMAA